MDSPVINAFAVPGGYVYITRGILAYLNSEAELAGVVGHEIGHVTARHSAQKYSEMSLAQLGLGIGSVISEDFANYAGLAAQGIGLLFLKFSRDDERQSDVLGVDYSSRVGYDATQMANFFRTLNKMQGQSKQGAIPDWFSTHPNPAERVTSVINEAKKKQKELGPKDYQINRGEYLAKIDGIIVGENPRQGFVDQNTFYHPDMKFQFPVPVNWQVNNLPTQVQMVDAQEKAVILFTLSGEATAAAAAQKYVSSTKARVAAEDETTVNGFKTKRVFSELSDGTNVLRVQSYFISKDKNVFVFHGFCDPSYFTTYQSYFNSTMTGFRQLTDRKILNVQPDRLQILKVSRNGTLGEILSGMGVMTEDQKKLALMNGMDLTENVQKSAQIKTIRKGR
jgi:predicted Zn-dependent protease